MCCSPSWQPGTAVAGVFTNSKSRSAPVDWCAEKLKSGSARALIVNSGNANAFTGKAGVKTVTDGRQSAGGAGQMPSQTRFSRPRPASSANRSIQRPIVNALAATVRRPCVDDAWAEAARAIMTTDTFPKAATRKARLGGVTVTLNGIAKGSGMIAPDMATMLAFIFTDAALPPRILQKLLSKQRGAKLQLHHRRWRHIDIGHASDVRDRQGRARRSRGSNRRAIRGSRISPARSTLCARTSRCKW